MPTGCSTPPATLQQSEHATGDVGQSLSIAQLRTTRSELNGKVGFSGIPIGDNVVVVVVGYSEQTGNGDEHLHY